MRTLGTNMVRFAVTHGFEIFHHNDVERRLTDVSGEVGASWDCRRSAGLRSGGAVRSRTENAGSEAGAPPAGCHLGDNVKMRSGEVIAEILA